MRRRRRTIGVLLTGLALILAACGGSGGEAEPTEPGPATDSGTQTEGAAAGLEEVVVGHIIPVSGPLSGPGEEVKQGVELAIEVWNEVRGTPHATLETCDDGGDPERSLTCVERLQDAGAQVFVGPHFGSMWRAAEPSYIDNGLFATTATPAADPPTDSNAFGGGTPHGPALQMIFGVFEDSGLSKVGFVHSTDASAQAAGEASVEAGQEVGIEVVKAEFANDAQTAVPQVQQLVAADVEAIGIWTTGPSVVTALRAINEVGFDGPVTLNYSNASPSTYELGADVVPEDLRVIASPGFVEGGVDDPERKELVDAFRQKHEEQFGPVSWNAMGGADSVIIALTAAANGTTPEEMAAYLESGAEVPAMTVTFKYSEQSHVGSTDPSALRLARFVDGKWEFAD